MILRGSLKPDAFLRTINRYVSGGEGDSSSVRKEGQAQIVYLGAGYWRAVLLAEATEHLQEGQPLSDLYGVYLVNPDRSQDEIQAVERGVAVLARLEYVDPRSLA